jgi:acyl-CoA thioesterase
LLGIEVIDAGPGWVKHGLPIRPDFLQPGVVHGGVISSLADTGTAHAVLTMIYPAEWTTTVEQKMSFLKPVTTGVIICNSKVIQLGGRLAFCDSQIVNDSGEIIATSSATLMRLTR